MPQHSTITLQMALDELKRQRRYFTQHYPRLVKEGKVTPYERDHRLAVNDTLTRLLTTAIKNKGTNQPNFAQLLNQLQ